MGQQGLMEYLNWAEDIGAVSALLVYGYDGQSNGQAQEPILGIYGKIQHRKQRVKALIPIKHQRDTLSEAKQSRRPTSTPMYRMPSMRFSLLRAMLQQTSGPSCEHNTVAPHHTKSSTLKLGMKTFS